jgi:hypothetical protein
MAEDEEEEYHTHEEYKRELFELLDRMIQENDTDSDAADNYIKSIVRDIMQNEDHGDEDNKDDLLHLIRQISSVLSGLDSEDYPYAKIAVEEITSIYNILYPIPNEEEGEEY